MNYDEKIWIRRADYHALADRVAELEAAGNAVVARWDTPLWKDVGPTAEVINALREALAPSALGIKVIVDPFMAPDAMELRSGQNVVRVTGLAAADNSKYAPVTELTDYPRNDREQP